MQSSATLAPGSSQQMPLSPGLSATAMSFESRDPSVEPLSNQRPPFFFREQYANLIVKGNFMTLAAKPVLVEEGEWLSHQGNTTMPTLHRSHTDTLPQQSSSRTAY
jgi:hypothetical protein